ncbi:ABC transporter ATP-binding protein, LivF homolog [Candidatus Profftella armatura (Diaphorina cf. continua)]|uniref:ABC transporter ATP-binding protein, LivF homolog n=1 Tax=Candidatus Profftella armatura (Diaphorina cf. continua) TaxID=2661583 RepID=A0A7R6VYN6_9PROT|nr:ATP-binding cassette domain-containing protein [Candidatus Profftella armatura (Diaphorina cf. continua)]BCG49552.1 ABC transporter ATP-binding protein, LivF homolog [Candidatus Profftella armatura (Diaphorina cf. continua)]
MKDKNKKYPILEIKNLYLKYNNKLILNKINLKIFYGEIVTLIGEKNSGKTTLAHALYNMLPYTGNITFNKNKIYKLTYDKIFKLGLAYVMQKNKLFNQITVEENLLIGAYLRTDKLLIIKDLNKIYSIFPQLFERRMQLAINLSNGEKKICSIARALMASPKFIIIDEISLGITSKIIKKIIKILVQIQKFGTTIFLIEKNAQLIIPISNHIYIIKNGNIINQKITKNYKYK